MNELVSINGEIFSPGDAKISVFDRGFLYGDSVYEVARSYGRIFFALEDHVERLFRSASRIDLDLNRTPQQIIEEIYRVYKKSSQNDVYMRLVVTRGDEDKISLDTKTGTSPNFVIFIKDLGQLSREYYERGVDIITASVKRNSKEALDPNIKSGNYLNSVMAITEAKQKKAFDALLVNREGFVTEGTTWNVFIVKNNVVVTPPDEADILQGITRQILRKICKGQGVLLEERFFTVDEFKKADEAFSTGSVKEVLGIRSIDGVVLGAGKPGPVTLMLSAAYKEYVKNYCEEREGTYNV